MPVAVVGTPTTAISKGGSYTAEAGSNRVAVFLVFAESGGSSRPLSTVTYGGKSCTVAVAVQTPGAGSSLCSVGIAWLNEADVSTRSGDVVSATWTGGDPAVGNRIFCYTLSDVDQTTPVGATGSNSANASTSLGMSLTSVANGLVISGAVGHIGTNAFTWATATERADVAVNSNNTRVSSAEYAPGSTSYSETVTNSSMDTAIVCASFSPVSGSVAPIVAYYQSMQD